MLKRLLARLLLGKKRSIFRAVKINGKAYFISVEEFIPADEQMKFFEAVYAPDKADSGEIIDQYTKKYPHLVNSL
jgi:hypothetical protein